MRLVSFSTPASRRLLLVSILSCVVWSARADLVPWPTLGFNLARGFQISLYADRRLADDIYSMTIDPKGNLVVSGPGYIRTLIDDNDDGVADRTILFANTPSGSMGMAFDGNDLLFVADGALWRLKDTDGDGQADGAPERLLALQWGEHGGHAVRRGPDGAFYVLAGNDGKLDPTQFGVANLPVSKVEGGALLRLKRNGGGIELLAHGFRNPYDFDFNADGDLFTYDSDAERDLALPWYLPTRFYHIPYGGHHGWRLEGYARSWPRPGHTLDSVESMATTGRASPTGLTFYRHLQFPQYYQDGLFAADWTFGRVYFVRCQADGSTWQGRPEIFLEPIGDHGFAPTDVAVGRSGDLFVATGGRNTPGAVYRIRSADTTSWTLASTWWAGVGQDVAALLNAPQPLEAWSRAVWYPAAAQFGPELFERVALDDLADPGVRIRSIEILTDVFDGLSPATGSACAAATSPWVRARAAWAMSVKPPSNLGPALLGLARDTASRVRVAALDALLQRQEDVDLVTRQQALAANLAHPDKRVRQAAARLACGLPEAAWLALWRQQQSGLAQARLTIALAMHWRARSSQVNTSVVEAALATLGSTSAPELQEQALRLIHLGLGDYHLENPSVELYTAYEPNLPLTAHSGLTRRLQKTLSGLLSGNAEVDAEAARLLAVLEADDPTLPAKLIAHCTRSSTATSDFHYLIAFSRLKAPSVTNFTGQVAATLLGLDQKLGAISQRPKQAWADRFVELTKALVQQNPILADALARHPDLARAAHLSIVPLLGPERYLTSARLFWNVVQRQPSFPWSPALIDLLSGLPPEDTHPLFRRRLTNVTLRERLLLELSAKPQAEDRQHYLAGLASPRPDVVRACMSALLLLPPDPSGHTATAALRLLRSLLREPADQTARAQVLVLLTRQTGQKFTVQERPAADLAAAYQPVFDWFFTRTPALLQQLDADDQDTPARWEPVLRSAPWAKGSPPRGEALYQARGCQNCHEGPNPLGPDLGGVAQRLGFTDLLRAILFPSRDVAPAYRMTTFSTRNGQKHTGLVALESADGVLLRAGPDLTIRLAEDDIVGREPSPVSFMPGGLLTGLTGQDLADLAAYLKTLPPAR